MYTVAIVNDCQDLRRALATYFEGEGFAVREYPSGR
jgi:hypothetical protein